MADVGESLRQCDHVPEPPEERPDPRRARAGSDVGRRQLYRRAAGDDGDTARAGSGRRDRVDRVVVGTAQHVPVDDGALPPRVDRRRRHAPRTRRRRRRLPTAPPVRHDLRYV